MTDNRYTMISVKREKGLFRLRLHHMFLDAGQRTVAIALWITGFSVGGAIGPLRLCLRPRVVGRSGQRPGLNRTISIYPTP